MVISQVTQRQDQFELDVLAFFKNLGFTTQSDTDDLVRMQRGDEVTMVMNQRAKGCIAVHTKDGTHLLTIYIHESGFREVKPKITGFYGLLLANLFVEMVPHPKIDWLRSIIRVQSAATEAQS